MISPGFVEHTVHLCDELSINHEVLLIMSGIPGYGDEEMIRTFQEKFSKNRFQIRYTQSYSKKDPRNIFSIVSIKKEIISFKPDLICVQAGYQPWLLLLRSYFKNHPFVLDLHDPVTLLAGGSTKYLTFRRFLINQLIGLSDCVIVHGRKLASDLMKSYDVDKKNIAVLKRGAYEISKVYEQQPSKKIRNRILFFGRIHRHKGIDVLVKSQPLVSSRIPDAVYQIIGKESYHDYKRFIINKDKFILEPVMVPWTEIHNIFRKADIVVLPYLDATQSGVLSTALAYRKPVIITSVGGMPEMVLQGKTGIIVAPNNVKALAAAIVLLLSNKKLKQNIIDNINDALENELCWSRTIKPVEKAFHYALAKYPIYE